METAIPLPPKGEMTKTEARELKPVVNRSADRAIEDVKVRARELSATAGEYLKKERMPEVQEVQFRIDALRSKHEALVREASELMEDILERGLTVDGAATFSYNYSGKVGRRTRTPILITEPEYSKIEVDLEYGSRDLQEQIRIKRDQAILDINRTRDNLLNKLTLRTVSSEEAREFVEGLPTVDTFLPLPNGKSIKEILELESGE